MSTSSASKVVLDEHWRVGVSIGVMVKGVGPNEDRLDEEEKGKQDEDEAAAGVAATEEEKDEITLAPMGSFCNSSRMDSMPGMLHC